MREVWVILQCSMCIFIQFHYLYSVIVVLYNQSGKIPFFVFFFFFLVASCTGLIRFQLDSTMGLLDLLSV